MLKVAGLLAVAIALLVFAQCTAEAHEWYDADCCSEMDCRPALASEFKFYDDGIEYLPTGQRFEWGRDKLRPSQDADSHVCLVGRYDPVTKVYMPKSWAKCIYYAIGG